MAESVTEPLHVTDRSLISQITKVLESSTPTSTISTELQQDTTQSPKKRSRPQKTQSQTNSDSRDDNSEPKQKRRRYRSQKQVHELLKTLGIKDPTSVSACLKEGIRREFIKLSPPLEDPDGKFGLDQILVTDMCCQCSRRVIARVRDVLEQQEVGYDYEDGAPNSKLRCPEDCCGFYVTNMCTGTPKLDTGKFHNHCTKCPSFGRCLNDYREVHCPKCNKHYYGRGIVKCIRCHPEQAL